MTELDTLLRDAESYADAADVSIATVSRKLFGDGTRIRKIKEGRASALESTIRRARVRLSDLQTKLGLDAA